MIAKWFLERRANARTTRATKCIRASFDYSTAFLLILWHSTTHRRLPRLKYNWSLYHNLGCFLLASGKATHALLLWRRVRRRPVASSRKNDAMNPQVAIYTYRDNITHPSTWVHHIPYIGCFGVHCESARGIFLNALCYFVQSLLRKLAVLWCRCGWRLGDVENNKPVGVFAIWRNSHLFRNTYLMGSRWSRNNI